MGGQVPERLQAIVERWNNADGSVDYLWSVWQDGRRIQMGGRCASAEAAEGEARAFCVNSLGREPQEVRRL